MERIQLPNIEALKKKTVSKHKTESAAICEEIGKEFKMNCYWMMYRYHPRVMRDALKAFQTAEKLPVFSSPQRRFAYFLGILKKTI